VRAKLSVVASLALFGVVLGIALEASAQAVEGLPNSEIFVVTADGTGRHNLTRSLADEDFPSLAPDGRRLVFIRVAEGQLWMMNADGTRQRRLTDAREWRGTPRWSPDGRRIAFTHKTTKVGLFEPDRNELQWIPDASDPSWAPTGERLAFLTDYGEGWREGPFSIAVANVDGLARRVVVRASDYSAYKLLSPFWSPTGSLIAFSLYSKGSRAFPLYVVDVDGPSTVRRVAPFGYNPAWSPDGRRLAFTNPRGIWIVGADGSGRRVIVSSRSYSNPRNPAWSPDGKRIAFVVSTSSCCPGKLFVVNPNRGRPRVLATRVDRAARTPVWSRDGRKVYYVGLTGPRRQ
jgi:TolB protein